MKELQMPEVRDISETFQVRIEARVKNGLLIRARELRGLTIIKMAQALGIPYHVYGEYERLRMYPSRERQEKICKLLKLSVDAVFPQELKGFLPKKCIIEKDIPKIMLLPITQINELQLPMVDDLPKEFEFIKQQEVLEELLQKLSPKERKVIELRFGLHGKNPHTLEELGEIWERSRENQRQICKRAIRKLRAYKKNLNISYRTLGCR